MLGRITQTRMSKSTWQGAKIVGRIKITLTITPFKEEYTIS
jgi:hypothetical protein